MIFSDRVSISAIISFAAATIQPLLARCREHDLRAKMLVPPIRSFYLRFPAVVLIRKVILCRKLPGSGVSMPILAPSNAAGAPAGSGYGRLSSARDMSFASR